MIQKLQCGCTVLGNSAATELCNMLLSSIMKEVGIIETDIDREYLIVMIGSFDVT